MRRNQMSDNQRRYVSYVERHPGATIADVDRACRINPVAGHKWVYDGVARLRRRGILADIELRGRVYLYPVTA